MLQSATLATRLMIYLSVLTQSSLAVRRQKQNFSRMYHDLKSHTIMHYRIVFQYNTA